MTDFFKFRQDLSEKKAFNLKEGSMKDAAKELEDYAKKSSSGDKNDFMKAVSMMKKQDEKGLAQFVNKLDTDPKEKIIDTVKNALGKRETEKLFDVKVLRDEKELDPVKDKALDKKFKNRKDKDIDNDGDVDSSDEYLHKRRKTIDKAIDKESSKKKTVSEASTKELKNLDIGDDVMVNGKMGMFYGMQGSKVKVRFPSGQETVSAKDVEIMDLMMDDLEKDDDDPCWDGYVQVGTKMKDGKEVPKCVPMEEAKKHMKEEFSKILSEKKISSKDEKELSKLMTKALGGKQPKSGYTSDIANNGDFVVRDGGGRVVGRIKKGEFENPMKESVNEGYYDYPDYGSTGAAEMAMTQLYFIQYAAGEVIECLKAGTVMPEWYQNKIAKLEGDMEGIHSYMAGKKLKREMCGPDEMGMDDYDYDMDDGEDDIDDEVMDSQMMAMGMYESKNLNEKFSVYKSMSPSSGKSVSNKAMVKSFKSKDDMYKFLGKGDNALHWKETGVEGLKSGKYRLNKVRGKDGKPANEFIKESKSVGAYVWKSAMDNPFAVTATVNRVKGERVKSFDNLKDAIKVADKNKDGQVTHNVSGKVLYKDGKKTRDARMYEAKSVEEGTGKISSFKDDREKSSAAELAKKAGLKVKDTGDGIELSGNMKKISDVLSSAQKRGAKVEESTQISEKLSATDDISDWIKDFKDSDAPQFQGKSAEERRDMAIAAYYDARDKAGYDTPQQGED